MQDIVKLLCTIVLVFGVPIAFVCGAMDIDDGQIRVVTFAVITTDLICLAILLYWYLQWDSEPDYLHALAGQYFNRNGFCFSFTTLTIGEVFHIGIHFQNQQDQPCIARLALRPQGSLFREKAALDEIAMEFMCPPGAFGLAMCPVYVPPRYQGTSQTYEFGACAKYPEGRGSRLRHREGITVRTDSQFKNRFGDTLLVLGILGGHLHLHRAPAVVIDLPCGVQSTGPEVVSPEVVVHWMCGDPPLRHRVPLAADRGSDTPL